MEILRALTLWRLEMPSQSTQKADQVFEFFVKAADEYAAAKGLSKMPTRIAWLALAGEGDSSFVERYVARFGQGSPVRKYLENLRPIWGRKFSESPRNEDAFMATLVAMAEGNAPPKGFLRNLRPGRPRKS